MDTDAELIAGIEKGIESGEFVRFDGELPEEQEERQMEEEKYSQLATPGDAHREWHLNAGVPMGTPGCPQDACHPPDDYGTWDLDAIDVDPAPDATPTGPRYARNLEADDRPATEKQIALLTKLSAEKDLEHPVAKRSIALVRAQYTDGLLGVRQASAAISDLIGAPYAVKLEAVGKAEPQEGMHKLGEQIYKVQRSPRTGHLYAKRLRVDADGGTSFEYAAGAVRKLSPETYMTIEQAKEFGALYGTCVRCGRTLTAEDSIDRMMGPICFGRQFGE